MDYPVIRMPCLLSITPLLLIVFKKVYGQAATSLSAFDHQNHCGLARVFVFLSVYPYYFTRVSCEPFNPLTILVLLPVVNTTFPRSHYGMFCTGNTRTINARLTGRGSRGWS